MDSNKLETISNLFENKEIRSIWDSEKEEYFFSVVDVISALTDSKNPNDYWYRLKTRMTEEEKSELSTKCRQLKMKAQDGKMRDTDTLDTKGILRLIESVPSPKAEPFKLWLASLGSERIDEVFNPEIAVNRAVEYYRSRGYTDEWIKSRLMGIVDRFKLTDVWKEGGITKPIEYALLTNEIYKGWSGMKASEYKKLKGIRKESLRDNMTDIEVALTNIGEIATRDIAREERPQGLKENLNVAKRGGGVAKGAKDLYEKETKKSAISQSNSLNYKYIDEAKQIVNKETEEYTEILEIKKINNECMLEEALNIRDTVFTKEKNVPKEIEVDKYDEICTNCDHFLIVYNSINIGTLRCLKINNETIKIQRFCFLKDYRNLGLGRKTLKYIEDYYKNKKIIMDAKYQVSGFYEKCGYQKVSEVFIEAGIEHIKMVKDLRTDE